MALALEAAGKDAYAPIQSRLSNQAKPVGLGLQRLANGVGIGPLRATSSPAMGADSQVLPASGAALVEPPPDGRKLLNMLQGSARDSSSLTAALGSGPLGTTSMGVLQARLTSARSLLSKIDGRSRFMNADRGDKLSNVWFKPPLAQVKFDLSG